MKKAKGITMISLVITIIILLILAGVGIVGLLSNNGILNNTKKAANATKEKKAMETLELELMDLSIDKNSSENYNKNDYVTQKLTEKGMIVNGDYITTEGYIFKIDREELKIECILGKGIYENQNIKIETEVVGKIDLKTSIIKVKVKSDIGIQNIELDNEILDIENEKTNEYTAKKEVTENKKYYIFVKNINDEFKIIDIDISEEITKIELLSSEDIGEFRNLVNNGNTFENKTVVLGNDIDLNNLCSSEKGSWEPIGNSTNKFKGTFDGNNFVIRNVYINVTTANQGFFGVVQNGNLRNLQIGGTVTTTVNNCGLLVGYLSGKIENVKTISNSKVKGNCYVAGIAGIVATDAQIIRCENNAQISGVMGIGGITGVYGIINESANKGAIIGSSGYIGGITGINATTNYCYNTGNVTGNGNDGTGYTSVGGISGAGTIATYCYNTGTVYGAKGQAAGIVGNVYNMKINVIKNCYNIGTISGSGRAIGSIGGECYTCTISNCLYTTTNPTCGYRGTPTNCRKVTEGELKAFSDQYFVTDQSNINNGYPILKWQI